MNYREEKNQSKKYKEAYLDGLEVLIRQRQKEAERMRYEYIKDVFLNQEKYRDDFKKMLGWPLVDYKKDGIVMPMIDKLSDEDGFSVYRMRFEILDGLYMTGLFLKADTDESRPLIIAQHGALGTPELIAGVYGSTANYNDMTERVLKYGVNVFAPQLLLWSDEYDVPYDRIAVDARLKRLGSSITAVEIFGITRILDYFETREYVSSIGMIGLSYGGFYTLFTAAVDTRIKAAISCSFFNTRDEYTWSDWTWFDSARRFDDAEIAALIYPRKLCIEMGKNDELFDYSLSIKSFDKLNEILALIDGKQTENSFIVFDGTHEFCKDDKPIEELVQELNKTKENV